MEGEGLWRGRGYRWEGMEGEGLQVREGMMEGL